MEYQEQRIQLLSTRPVSPRPRGAPDHTIHKNNFAAFNTSRSVGLLLLVSFFVGVFWYSYRPTTIIYDDLPSPTAPCYPGIKGDILSQLPLHVWRPPTAPNLILPLYTTHVLNEVDQQRVVTAIIVQHGNLRNANDYYCAAVNSLASSGSPQTFDDSVAIIAPQFSTEGDLCWDPDTAQPKVITSDASCGYPLWSMEGWKDGHASVGGVTPTPPLFSYDVFDHLIDHLSNKMFFPNLKNITFFGFSAGAQTVLRYAAMPNHQTSRNPFVQVKYVISDPSTYLYLSPERPYTYIDQDGFNRVGFRVPNATLLPSRWGVDSQGMPWITSWDTQCGTYNKWRYGLLEPSGYYAARLKADPGLVDKIIQNFRQQDITYLAGTGDMLNCKLNYYMGCNDNELATYCQAMLQGDNRLDRILKWREYLNFFYNSRTQDISQPEGDVFQEDIHKVVFAEGVVHDPVQMINTDIWRCVVLLVCPQTLGPLTMPLVPQQQPRDRQQLRHHNNNNKQEPQE